MSKGKGGNEAEVGRLICEGASRGGVAGGSSGQGWAGRGRQWGGQGKGVFVEGRSAGGWKNREEENVDARTRK